jgi:hypothetical protein
VSTRFRAGAGRHPLRAATARLTAAALTGATLTAALALGCAPPPIQVDQGPREYVATDYEEVLRRWTRTESLVSLAELDNFLTATATYESWDFRWAYVVRYLFEGLHPEISVEDAQKSWGQPDREEERPHGPCWIYQRELGVVELCLEEWGSPPFPYVDKWVLHGVPQDSDPQALLDPAVLRLLPSNLEKLDISIMKDEGDRPAVILEIRNGSVERMTWFH